MDGVDHICIDRGFFGFSRVFQGGHYLTDVIGGYAFGLAWAGFIYLLMENIFWKRKA